MKDDNLNPEDQKTQNYLCKENYGSQGTFQELLNTLRDQGQFLIFFLKANKKTYPTRKSNIGI